MMTCRFILLSHHLLPYSRSTFNRGRLSATLHHRAWQYTAGNIINRQKTRCQSNVSLHTSREGQANPVSIQNTYSKRLFSFLGRRPFSHAHSSLDLLLPRLAALLVQHQTLPPVCSSLLSSSWHNIPLQLTKKMTSTLTDGFVLDEQSVHGF